MNSEFNKGDYGVPFSFRVPERLHRKYKKLNSFQRKELHLKLIKYLQRSLK
jgi:hypothetical protein